MTTPDPYTDAGRHDPLADRPEGYAGVDQRVPQHTDTRSSDPRYSDTQYDAQYKEAEQAASRPRAVDTPGSVAGGTTTVVGVDGPPNAQDSGGPERTAPADTRRTPQPGADELRDAQDPDAHGAEYTDGAERDADTDGRERLVAADRAENYGSRWDAIKGTFVDEPRQAVAQADALVGELLEELEQLFRRQRRGIEQGLDADETSTEDLRLALRRYRSFFDRLLSL